MTITRIPRMLTVPEASAATQSDGAKGISESTLRKEIKAGKLRTRRIRGAVRILDDDFAEYLRGRKS